MVDPKIGQYYLLCLLPTTLRGVYASLTAPFDDNRAIFLLDHKRWTRATYYKDGKEVAFHEQSEKNRALWDLVDNEGELHREGVEYLRKKYETEITAQSAKDAVIHLKWKKETSASGWEWNIPDDSSDGAEKKKAKRA